MFHFYCLHRFRIVTKSFFLIIISFQLLAASCLFAVILPVEYYCCYCYGLLLLCFCVICFVYVVVFLCYQHKHFLFHLTIIDLVASPVDESLLNSWSCESLRTISEEDGFSRLIFSPRIVSFIFVFSIA